MSILILAVPVFAPVSAQSQARSQLVVVAADTTALNIASFETVWTTIRDKHWEKTPGGLDWQAIHEEFRPRIEKAANIDEARDVMSEMLQRLHQTHFAILPTSVYQDLEADIQGVGSAGFDARVLDGRAIVTDVEMGSPAARAGVKPGWEIFSANDRELRPLIAKLASDHNLSELQLERAVMARLTGPVGESRRFVFARENDQLLTRFIALVQPRGEMAAFGNLPAMPVWFESKRIPLQKAAGNVPGSVSSVSASAGYIRFNVFLDLVRVMDQFGDAVKACAARDSATSRPACAGLIIDLRGNPGGIGAMAIGMAGWLVSKPDQRLGTMYMRGATLKFAINPRAGSFEGPVAILVDGSSASTSEIFAGGLKDLGRAHVFGTRTAAAALPSVITKLPNGDGFQYAIANYISEGGKPLEGIGVIPDVEARLTREALLADHDAVIDSALDWMRKQKDGK